MLVSRLLSAYPWTRAAAVVLFIVSGDVCSAEDWPTYGHDAARTSTTREELAFPLVEAWSWRSPIEPTPIWDEPAVWDGWNKVYNLRNRVDFDKAFHVAIAGDRVWFGSSVEDQLLCADLKTGAILWKFFAEGPIRLAPVVHEGKVYFGSDDGHVYCLQGADGRLVWKRRLAPDGMRVAGNGRLISRWPVRTSVAVIDGSCYACAGVFPSETVYVVAMDAQTGEQQWQTQMNDLPAQGYLLASPSRLYVFPGRGGPVIFDRQSGDRLKHVDSVGGTYALLVDDTLVTTTGRDGRSLQAIDSAGGDRLATFPGVHMIMSGPMSYLQSNKELTAIDRRKYLALARRGAELGNEHAQVKRQLNELPAEAAQQRKPLEQQIVGLEKQINEVADAMKNCYEWKTECESRSSLILAGDTLISGGAGVVTGINIADGEHVFQAPVQGNAYGLAAANGRLVVSTDQGVIHTFAAGNAAAQPPNDVAAKNREDPYASQPKISTTELATDEPGHALGPFVRFTAPDRIEITWRTRQAAPTRLAFGWQEAEDASLFQSDAPATDHRVEIPDIGRGGLYSFWIAGSSTDNQTAWNGPHKFDALLNYTPPEFNETPQSAYANGANRDLCRKAARAMLDQLGVRRGFAFVLGAVDGQLAYELARSSDMKVVVIEDQPERVAQIREQLDAAGVYGSRVAVVGGPANQLEFAPYIANLITSESLLLDGRLPASFASVQPWLRPDGGTLWLGASEQHAKSWQQELMPTWEGPDNVQATWQEFGDSKAWVHRRAPLQGAGEWTHQYALPDNAACSRDETIRGDMRVLWWGRPGARPMPDRGGRNPAPVAAGGRLFVQGDRTLFGLDSYNGTILWARQNPTMRRSNVPRDGSNMVAADDLLYVAIGDTCVGFDAATGDLAFDLPVARVAGPTAKPDDQWGYLAVVGDQLIGSAVSSEAQYKADAGEWYEDFEEESVRRVESGALFAVDRHTGDVLWRYQHGNIMNSTIAIADDTAFFVESRAAQQDDQAGRRSLESTLSDQHLVAVSIDSGEVQWERPFDFSKCQFMTYLCHADGKLVVTGTDQQKTFHTFAFSTESGAFAWDDQAKANKTHHSGHLAHPTIVAGRVYFNKLVYDLHTGEVVEKDDFDWHGCGVMAASQHSIFSRFEFHGMLALDTKKRTEFLGVRSGCWLNIIPSGGLLLAPEMSSGCSCAHSIQTSLAFVPQQAIDESRTP